MNLASYPQTNSRASKALRVHPDDNVAVALEPLDPGEMVSIAGMKIAAKASIDAGHKLAIADLATGDTVIKFGCPIGKAIAPIGIGEHVHIHNVQTLLSGTEGYRFEHQAPSPLPSDDIRFLGYRQCDGRVGTRNEVWILPTVGCVARTSERIASLSRERHAKVVDGIYAFHHQFGCSQLGDDLAGTRSLLASLACNPNAGGVLIIGLGCESNQLDALLQQVPEQLRGKVQMLVAQAEDDEIEAGMAAVDSLVAQAARRRRAPESLSKLVVGLKCGGSDGFSGLTANPLVGRICDLVVGSGGSALLSEVPEMFGAERLLMARARDRRTFNSIVELVNDFKSYFLAHGQPVSENPSPGNLAGGITTLEEKSLGAIQKAGRASVAEVLRYGERISGEGLALLEAPGNDAVSSTALAAAGATLILFTTGRGTPMGFPVPTVKIASNSSLAQRKRNWIDFDAGAVLAQGMDQTSADLLTVIARVASGEMTASERNGEREIAIWKRGVTL